MPARMGYSMRSMDAPPPLARRPGRGHVVAAHQDVGAGRDVAARLPVEPKPVGEGHHAHGACDVHPADIGQLEAQRRPVTGAPLMSSRPAAQVAHAR